MNTDQPDPLVPELREAELQLDGALAEACETPPSSEAATGDLIRVDELLATAADAAKRAISLRRRRRVDRTQPEPRASSIGDVEAAMSPLTAHRVVVDPRGVHWDVFAVLPEARVSVHSKLRGTFSQGWLCFDSGTEKRRLSPIPKDWEALEDAQLADLATRAEAASSRRSRPSNDSGADDRGKRG